MAKQKSDWVRRVLHPFYLIIAHRDVHRMPLLLLLRSFRDFWTFMMLISKDSIDQGALVKFVPHRPKGPGDHWSMCIRVTLHLQPESPVRRMSDIWHRPLLISNP